MSLTDVIVYVFVIKGIIITLAILILASRWRQTQGKELGIATENINIFLLIFGVLFLEYKSV